MEHDRDYYYSNIPWRHSGLRGSAFGIDPIVMVIIPMVFITLSRGWPTWFFYVYGMFFLAALYAKFRKFPTLFDWLASLRTRAQGVQWPTR